MMNKSKIEWCDFTWNPVTGCIHGCPYCYANKQATRFCGNIRINKASGQIEKYRAHKGVQQGSPDLYILKNPFVGPGGKIVPLPTGFAPTFHEYRLKQVKQKQKPAVIFVVSMGDLFGDWVPDEWIRWVIEACKAAPQHRYLFLTKNPKRLYQLEKEGKLPDGDGFWYGTTVTTPDKPFFFSAKLHTFLSIEPMHAAFDREKDGKPFCGITLCDWIIVGEETGQRTDKILPHPEWVESIVSQCQDAGKPVFTKDNLSLTYIAPSKQEYPDALKAVKNEI